MKITAHRMSLPLRFSQLLQVCLQVFDTDLVILGGYAILGDIKRFSRKLEPIADIAQALG